MDRFQELVVCLEFLYGYTIQFVHVRGQGIYVFSGRPSWKTSWTVLRCCRLTLSQTLCKQEQPYLCQWFTEFCAIQHSLSGHTLRFVPYFWRIGMSFPAVFAWWIMLLVHYHRNLSSFFFSNGIAKQNWVLFSVMKESSICTSRFWNLEVILL